MCLWRLGRLWWCFAAYALFLVILKDIEKENGLGPLVLVVCCCWLPSFICKVATLDLGHCFSYLNILSFVFWAYVGLMAFLAFWIVCLWQVHLCFACIFVHPFVVLGISTKLIVLSRVPSDRL